MRHEKKINKDIDKIIINDHNSNYKSYAIPKAQLIIADVPFNIGLDAYASNPSWYKGGDRKNGESEKAKKSFFRADLNFKPAEFMHFASTMLKKEPKNKSIKDNNGKSIKQKSTSGCMVLFCGFDQLHYFIELGKRYGFKHYTELVFRKNYSPQVLKANMKIVGNCEYGLLLYRERLPKFNNNGKMFFNCFDFPRHEKSEYNPETGEKYHETQKPIKLIKTLIKLFTDKGDVVIDPTSGGGTTQCAAIELDRDTYGFEIDKQIYRKAKKRIFHTLNKVNDIKKVGFPVTEMREKEPILF